MSLVILTTILTLSALYAPQPLLPVLAREFAVSRDAAAFLTTIAMLPLSLAPLVYGYVLQAVPPRRLLRAGVLLLAVSEVVLAAAGSYPLLVVLRLCQGLLIPALLTALMTYVSQVSSGATVQRAMGIYVAATILGGFLGRLVSGGVASLWSWRYSFLLLALSLGVCFVLLGRLRDASVISLVRPRPDLLVEVLRQRTFLRAYLAIFCLFLVFAAVMNFIPFRLVEISNQASEFRIGLMYCGYLMGMVTALLAVRIGRLLGGEVRAMVLGLGVYTLALSGFGVADPRVLFAVMFLFCGAMFLVHATASGWLNRHAGGHKGVVNGLYVAFYYGGGVVGSSVPGLLYHRLGWEGFLTFLLVTAGAGLGLACSCLGADPQGLLPPASAGESPGRIDSGP